MTYRVNYYITLCDALMYFIFVEHYLFLLQSPVDLTDYDKYIGINLFFSNSPLN